MFISFEDQDGDLVSFNINHVVGFEFPKAGGETLVQLITGKVAKIKDDKATIAEKFRQIYNHTNVNLWWEFSSVPEQNVAPSP